MTTYTSTDQATDHLEALAREAFGLATDRPQENVVTVGVAGLAHLVVLNFASGFPCDDPLLCVYVRVGDLDWDGGAVADFLLREQGRMVCARCVRVDDALVVDWDLDGGELTSHRLRAAVDAVVREALRLRELLGRLDVLAG